MPKTAAPGTIDIPGVATFKANALPDPFDARDLEYRPRLQLLPESIDRRADLDRHVVLKQQGQSCTGHAVAAMVNTIIGNLERERGGATGQASRVGANPPKAPSLPRVSPYMLYRLGRRYDEFDGEDDSGSSLRGVLKGWYHHGVALDSVWPKLRMTVEPDIDDVDWLIANTADRPLGAYYRVNAMRLDDMQSAINELQVIVASALVHEGWIKPIPFDKTRADGTEETIYLIKRDVTARAIGGHAFAIVGYNDVGFLVQNSWGRNWGKGGFATLAYEDWLDSAYDAWVARPGVPKTPFARGRSSTIPVSGGNLATGASPDLRRLAYHAVSLGGGGRLSDRGKFVTKPRDIDVMFQYATKLHAHWRSKGLSQERHIVLYAHGGLVSEEDGLAIAQRQLNWWLNNRVFPISFIWHSGLLETVGNLVNDALDRILGGGRAGFDVMERIDRSIEGVCKEHLRSVWQKMKENAAAASVPIRGADGLTWPPLSSQDIQRMAELPGASLTIARLKRYMAEPGGPVRVHVVGHSAGSIFLSGLVALLKANEIPVRTAVFMAGGLRAEEFERRVLPLVRDKSIDRMVNFTLSDQLEQDDTCPGNGRNLYHKSLLYLVSRGFEPASREFEIPLIGMDRSLTLPRPNSVPLKDVLQAAGVVMVTAPATGSDPLRSDARHHGDFDDDTLTMTSVVMNLRRLTERLPETEYQAHSALDPNVIPPQPDAAQAPARSGRGDLPAPMAAEAAPVGDSPLTTSAEPAKYESQSMPTSDQRVCVEVADAPRSGSPTVDMLAATGWRYRSTSALDRDSESGTKAVAKGKRKPSVKARPLDG